ncbi:MAG: NYN domain-containing protein [Candidatus Lernaella stagnicola]|nr:NYN domain-containing protein [Candidatus Lernaella stagnicola]
MARVQIFCDFWNFQLSLKRYDSRVSMDYMKIPVVLVREASQKDEVGKYEGCTVYSSYDSLKPNDMSMKAWLTNTVGSFDGFIIKIFERRPASFPHCPNCDKDILDCPNCNTKLRRTVEKGVDTAIVTDMLQHAVDDNYDYGVLLSSDRDFIPAVEFIQRQGKKIVHAGFDPASGRELANTCWKRIDLRNFVDELKM